MIGNALKRIRKEQGLSQIELASKLGVAHSSLAEYETDKRMPRPEALLGICKALNTTPNYLYGFTEQTGGAVRPIPLLGVIRAGLPLLADANYSETITLSVYERGVDFALRVTGDSMVFAGIREGDIVLMRQTENAQTGDIVAAVLQDGDQLSTLKYYVAGKPPVLRAANPKYEDQIITSNHRIIGTCQGLVRSEAPSLREYQALLGMLEELDEEWESVIADATSAGLGAAEIKSLIDVIKKTKR